MASLSYDKNNNRWLVQFVSPDGSRKTVTTKGSKRSRDNGRQKANSFREKIDELLSNRLRGQSVPADLAKWVIGLPVETYDKLAAAGLLEERASTKLGPFLADWFEKRKHRKESTLTVWGHARRNLTDYFGANKDLRSINEADAEEFELWLSEHEKLAESTVRKRCGFAKQMLASAVKTRLIETNPLQALKVAAKGNKKRQYFVTEAEAQKVLLACPNAEWRAAFALARYGALRMPSEIEELKWTDIDWQNERFRVHAPKTEHHADNGDRLPPLFPEVRKALSELWDQTPEGTVYVLPKIRKLTNINPQLGRIIKNAGLKIWPKRWQNLRATRATELRRHFPEEVVVDWCGHTETIAMEHYWMTLEEDYQKASTFNIPDAYMMQQCVANGGNRLNPESTAHEKSPVLPSFAKPCELPRRPQVEDRGHQ